LVVLGEFLAPLHRRPRVVESLRQGIIREAPARLHGIFELLHLSRPVAGCPFSVLTSI
jgi:hypothetical protein